MGYSTCVLGAAGPVVWYCPCVRGVLPAVCRMFYASPLTGSGVGWCWAGLPGPGLLGLGPRGRSCGLGTSGCSSGLAFCLWPSGCSTVLCACLAGFVCGGGGYAWFGVGGGRGVVGAVRVSCGRGG